MVLPTYRRRSRTFTGCSAQKSLLHIAVLPISAPRVRALARQGNRPAMLIYLHSRTVCGPRAVLQFMFVSIHFAWRGGSSSSRMKHYIDFGRYIPNGSGCFGISKEKVNRTVAF